jgi:pimeloyl-ACP methyl ester carboxylesterase
MAGDVAELASHVGFDQFRVAGEDWGAAIAYAVAAFYRSSPTESCCAAQDISGVDPDYCLVAEVRSQLVLTAPAATFFRRVEWT